MESSIIIVIDMQNDFVYGPLGSRHARWTADNIKDLLEEGRESNSKIIFTRDTHTEDEYEKSLEGSKIDKHCIKGTEGWNIVPELDTTGATIIDKNTFGFLGWKDYIDENDDRDIIIAGTCAEICVISNALILRALFPNKRIVMKTEYISGGGINQIYEALDVAKGNLIETDVINGY